MRIVVNHVTRMKPPRICVAGFDSVTLEHVRPTTYRGDEIARDLLRENGGPFGMGAVVELGPTVPRPVPPEVEDHRFKTVGARHVEDLDGDEFVELLDRVKATSIEEAFGPQLKRVGKWKYATDAGCGSCSLAVIRPTKRPRLAVDKFGELELRFDDVEPQVYVRVNDVRFYDADQKTIKRSVVEDVRLRLLRGVDAYLMFGLTRAYPSDAPEHHWLQLNGLCMTDRPTGDSP